MRQGARPSTHDCRRPPPLAPHAGGGAGLHARHGVRLLLHGGRRGRCHVVGDGGAAEEGERGHVLGHALHRLPPLLVAESPLLRRHGGRLLGRGGAGCLGVAAVCVGRLCSSCGRLGRARGGAGGSGAMAMARSPLPGLAGSRRCRCRRRSALALAPMPACLPGQPANKPTPTARQAGWGSGRCRHRHRPCCRCARAGVQACAAGHAPAVHG